jgi:hypothetical protein
MLTTKKINENIRRHPLKHSLAIINYKSVVISAPRGWLPAVWKQFKLYCFLMRRILIYFSLLFFVSAFGAGYATSRC